jgi:hypothetical protein
MQTQVHPLESFFNSVVQSTFETKLGLHDPEMIAYVTRLLCEFSEPDSVFRLHDATGKRIETLEEMVRASDPVHGTAASFEEEREVRKYICDYALFVAGMCHDVVKPDSSSQQDGPTLAELIEVGKESCYIVSQFNVFEFEKEAPLFVRLTKEYERCILGLAMVREELGDNKLSASPEIKG